MNEAYGNAFTRIRIDLHLENVSVPVKQAAALGLLMNELITNAYKHAFPDGRSGVVVVRLSTTKAATILEVSDDGIGLPPVPGDAKPAGSGMQLVELLTLQLGGILTRGTGGSAAVSITVPFPEP